MKKSRMLAQMDLVSVSYSSSICAGSPIADVPFIPELFDMVFPCALTGKLKCIRNYPFQKMIELLDVDFEMFCSMKTAGLRKWVLFQEMRALLISPDVQARIVEVYHCCFLRHEFPELPKGKERKLSVGKLMELAIRQYISWLERVAEFRGEVSLMLERMKLFFYGGHTRVEIAEMLGITTERVRQLRIYLTKAMFEGTLPGATNLQISVLLKEEMELLLQRLPVICSEKTLNEALQCDDFPKSWLNLVLPLQCVPQNRTALKKGEFRMFDQLYYIPADKSADWAKIYIRSVCGVMGRHPEVFEIRPIELDGVMALLNEVEPSFDFNKDIVLGLLRQHEWMEEVIEDGVVKFQMKYHYLQADYKCLARLVYEKKCLHLKLVDQIHCERMGNHNEPSILKSASNVKNRVPWVVFGGKNGVIEYNEAGVTRMKMIDAVKEWTEAHVLFTIEELMDALNGMGYTGISEQTLRAYIMTDCHVDNAQRNLFCRSECVARFKEGHNWRSKPQMGLTNWLARKLHSYLMEVSCYSLPIKEIESRLAKDIEEEQVRYRLNHPVSYYLNHKLKDYKLFVVKNGMLRITAKGRKLTLKELDLVGVRNRKGNFYAKAVSKAISMLESSPNGEVLLIDFVNECRDLIGGRADTVLYRIVDLCMPDNVVKIKHDGRLYLKLLNHESD